MVIRYLKAFQIAALILCFLFSSGKAAADYMVGMAINPSSNMFLRPNGKSGTIAYLYGKADFSTGKVSFSYGINGGMVEHYRGLQFVFHSGHSAKEYSSVSPLIIL